MDLLPDHLELFECTDAMVSAEMLANRVAMCLRGAIAKRGQALLVVSGGRSPVDFFICLSQIPLDWACVFVTLADERWVPPDQPDSNERLVKRYLLQNEARDARWQGLFQSADSLDEAAEKAENALAALPWPIDALVLGMGEDGHTASLFPASPGLAAAMSGAGANGRRCLPMQAPSPPLERLTLTAPVLAGAGECFLLLQGRQKYEVLKQALTCLDRYEELPIRFFLRRPLAIYRSL